MNNEQQPVLSQSDVEQHIGYFVEGCKKVDNVTFTPGFGPAFPSREDKQLETSLVFPDAVPVKLSVKPFILFRTVQSGKVTVPEQTLTIDALTASVADTVEGVEGEEKRYKTMRAYIASRAAREHLAALAALKEITKFDRTAREQDMRELFAELYTNSTVTYTVRVPTFVACARDVLKSLCAAKRLGGQRAVDAVIEFNRVATADPLVRYNRDWQGSLSAECVAAAYRLGCVAAR